MAHVLVVEDLKNVRMTLAITLREAGHQVVEADGGISALELLEGSVFDLVITDLRMDEVDGLSLLRTIKQVSPPTEVIVMTAYGTVEAGVAAMKAGAYDFLTKPVKPDALMIVVDQALEKRRLGEQLQRLLGAEGAACFHGSSRAWQSLLEQVGKVAPTDATVLLTGESGVGKEVVAHLLHAGSPRCGRALLTINLGAVSETLQESELFGHVKGAFTGAVSSRKGIFMEADGGTLFMDELGEAEPSIQVALLRVLAQGEMRPVGGDRDVRVDVRVIAATNADLEKAVAAGEFREDLFFRINVFPIRVPSLRERAEDIPGLARHLLARHVGRLGRQDVELSDDAIDVLVAHPWPGNVRELENLLERTLILTSGERIRAEDLPPLGPLRSAPAVSAAPRGGSKRLADVEREHVLRVLAECRGQRQKAAEVLDIGRATLFRKLKEYGVT